MDKLFRNSLWQAEAEDQAEELRQILSYNDSTGKL
jgi:hypothetical protein